MSFECLASKNGNKVLIHPVPGGSHLLFMRDLAVELIKHQYNVTMLMFSDSKQIEEYKGVGINLLFIPGVTSDRLIEAEKRFAKNEGAITDLFDACSMIFEGTKYDPEWIPRIKAEKFDLFIKEFFPSFTTMAHILDIPHSITVIAGPVESVLLKGSIGAPYHSTMVGSFEEPFVPVPNDVDDIMDRSSFFTRIRTFLGGFPSQIIFGYFFSKYTSDALAEEYRHLVGSEPRNDLVLTVGVEGLLDQHSVPPHVKSIYPLAKSKDLAPKAIPKEMAEFIDKHKHVILIAFGTTFYPQREFVEIIFKFAQENSEYGIVLSIKRSTSYEDIYDKMTSVQNILVSNWIPQRELLQSGKVDIFYTHGGFNSVMESLEGGVPMIVTPLILSDQQTNCKRILKNGYGFCLEKPTYNSFTRAIKEFEKRDFLKQDMAHVRKVVELKKQDPHDLVFWVRQVLEVGTQHLIPKDTLKLNFLQLQDLDIHFALFTLILILFSAIFFILKAILKMCCGKKNTKEKEE